MRGLISIVVAAITVLAFYPCSWAQNRPGITQTVKRAQDQVSEAEQSLRVRVSEYWKTLVAGNPNKAFDFAEPSAQNRENRSRFVNGMSKFQFIRYEIQKISITGDEAGVTVKREFKIAPGVIPLDPGILSQTLTDRWIKVKGKWYAAYNRPVLPFSGNKGKKPAPSVSLPKPHPSKKGGGKDKGSGQ